MRLFMLNCSPLLFCGFVSVISFILIAKFVCGYNASVRKVVIADWVAFACLGVAAILKTLGL